MDRVAEFERSHDRSDQFSETAAYTGGTNGYRRSAPETREANRGSDL